MGSGQSCSGGLSLAEVCAAVYALDLEAIDRRVTTETQTALLARVLGSDVEPPSYDGERTKYETWLKSDPSNPVNRRSAPGSDEETLRLALGLEV